jgi:hypothetical protein
MSEKPNIIQHTQILRQPNVVIEYREPLVEDEARRSGNAIAKYRMLRSMACFRVFCRLYSSLTRHA